jgi:hypothetical protein
MGEEDRLKARLTPKGYMQRKGIDYNEIFAPTLKYTTFRILMSIVASMDYELHQLDVSNAFLNAEVKEDVYMEMPEGFKSEEGDFVLKLVKALYGIHQAPREWYLLVKSFIIDKMGFKQCATDSCLFYKISKTGRLILMAMFVDDYAIGFHRDDLNEWLSLKKIFLERFKSTDKGEAKQMLGMRINRDRKNKTLQLDQEVYVTKKLEEFNMADCAQVATPEVSKLDLNTNHEFEDTNINDQPNHQEDDKKKVNNTLYMKLVGALLYASISTRPDISHAVHQLTMHTQLPLHKHWIAGKRVLRYLHGTKDIGLKFGGSKKENNYYNKIKNQTDSVHMVVEGYADADYANDTKDSKSITGWIVKLNGDVVSWQSKKQSTVALSTCEAELYAEASCIQEMMWLQNLLEEISINVEKPSTIWQDNQSTIHISKHGIIREKTKHVRVKYHFISEKIDQNLIEVKYIQTDKQQADILTKGLNKDLFTRIRKELMTR